MPGALRTRPGAVTGTMAQDAKMPALPCEVPEPGVLRSMIVTSIPVRRSQIAVDTPTMPAPITATWRVMNDTFVQQQWT